MKAKILGKITLRQKSPDNWQLYWSQGDRKGNRRQTFVHWGTLPTDKLRELVVLLNLALVDGKRSAKKRLARLARWRWADVQDTRTFDWFHDPESVRGFLLRHKAVVQSKKDMKLRRLHNWATGCNKRVQIAHTRNFWAQIVSKTCGLRVMMEEVEKNEPMEKWSADRLDIFLITAQPIVARFDRAKRLRQDRAGS